MSRNLKLYFEDILSSCHKICRYVNNMNYEEFLLDELKFDALIRNLQKKIIA